MVINFRFNLKKLTKMKKNNSRIYIRPFLNLSINEIADIIAIILLFTINKNIK